MGPDTTTGNCVYGAKRNAEIYCNILQQVSAFSSPSNCANSSYGELSATGFFPAIVWSAALARHVSHIVGMCAEKQMCWPYTQCVVATVKNVQSAGDGAVCVLPRKSVRCIRPARTLTKAPVSVRSATAARSSPQPTRLGFFHPPPKSFRC